MDEGSLARLTYWLRESTGDADLTVGGLADVAFGHSAEMLTFTTSSRNGEQALVLKLQPPSPGLLEPYDLPRQFAILSALAPTDVRAPRPRFLEPNGEVLGRPFYVMDLVASASYEREVPEALDAPGVIPAMCEALVDQLAEIHSLPTSTPGLTGLGDPATYVDRELERWESEMVRVRRGPLPALERLLAELRAHRPAASGRAALVHGDAKPGNFGFSGTEVGAVFDWELTDVGDPMADIGYLELMWAYPIGITSRPSTPPFDAVLARWEQRTGLTAENRAWWLALASFKTAVILLVGSMLFDAGHSDDLRYLEMALGVDLTTRAGLQALGIHEEIPAGPVLPTDERIAEATSS